MTPMRKLLPLLILALAPSLFAADAADDILFAQRPSDNVGPAIQRNLAPIAGGASGFDSSKHPISYAASVFGWTWLSLADAAAGRTALALGALATQDGVAGSELTSAVPVSKGGTGLTALGSMLQVLRVNAAGTALEYATPSAGGSGDMLGANNLSDLTDPAAARGNLSLGTAALLNAPASGNAASGEAVIGTDTRLTNSRTPTAHTHPATDISDSTSVGRSVVTATDAAAARTAIGAGTSSFDGTYSSLSGKPTLGTAAALDVPSSGDATTGQVVKGTDTRLTDARTPTTHTHTASAISDSTSAGRALLTAADASAQRTALSLGTLATQSGTFSGTSSGTNTGDQTITLTGDVTGSGTGSFAATLANIPTATPMAGSVLATAIAAPSTPAAGKGSVYVDSTSKNIAVKDDAGVVKHGVQTISAAASQWIRAIDDAGSGTKSQPAFSDISGSVAASQMPALTGDVTTNAGAVATTLVNVPTATTFATDLTAQPNNNGGWNVYRVSGSDATTTGQALATITGLTTGTLSTSTLYEVEAVLFVTTSTGTNGTEYGITAGGTGSAAVPNVLLTGTTTTNAATTVTISTIDTATAAFLTTASINGVVFMKGFVTTRSGGTPTLSLQHLKVTSGTSTVKVGSIFRIRKA